MCCQSILENKCFLSIYSIPFILTVVQCILRLNNYLSVPQLHLAFKKRKKLLQRLHLYAILALFQVIVHCSGQRHQQKNAYSLNCKCAIVLVLAPLCSMLPLFLKDGLLMPYVVTSLAFLFFSIYLLSALEHCSEEELRLGVYHKLFFCLPKMDLA